MDFLDQAAKEMFDAYNRAGPNPGKTFDGRDVPPFEQCGEQVQGKWKAAALKAWNLFQRPAPMSFGEALVALHDGEKVARSGWNREGMWLELQRPDANSKMSQPYLFITPSEGCRVPWVASQPDLLSKDWYVVK